jgi:hypothetical protein
MDTSKKIKVRLPVNLTEQEFETFANNQIYTLRKTKVKKLRQAFVSYEGYCLNTQGLVKGCYHDYPHQLPRFLKEASEAYYDIVDHPENLIELKDDETYLMIHHPWFMYYHWVCESLPRIWAVKEQLQDLVLLLPEHYRHNNFVLSSISAFTFKDIFYIPQGKGVLADRLLMPEIKPIMESYDARIFLQLSCLYKQFAIKQFDIHVSKHDRVFISRSKSGRRKIVNEAEVIKVLEEYGFRTLYCEDYSFIEQVAIFSNIKYLVALHGSGLSNMIFMPPQAKVMEFHKTKTNDGDWHSLIFWYMADAMNLQYYHQICSPVNPADDLFIADVLVESSLLKINLSVMLS